VRRREFIALLGGAAVWPLVARAQPKEMPIVGVLRLDNEQHWFLESLREGLRDHGLVEGVNVKLLIRFADGDPAQLPGRARELAAAGSRVIVTNGTTLVAAVYSAAPSMPIVMAGSADPVAMGFAQSLARPGGRITGISILGAELIGKHMELLKDIAPKARLFVALLQSANPGNNRFRQAFADAGRTLAVEIQVREVRSEGELADAFALAKKLAADGVYVIQDPMFYRIRATLAKLAEAARLPLVAGHADYVRAGALAAYVLDNRSIVRRSGHYVAEILRGGDPADMPIEQPTKIHLILNARTANALGLTIPPPLLAGADEVIE
jgi:putative tryptophan/tyrosine transport system substrate-binding protein